jgi:branched-chain amino acid aminotransferase
MPLICYVNGEFVPAEQAKVSAFDHGFLYGDGIFESLTARNGRLFKFREHLDRLERSARALRLDLPETKERVAEIVKECVRRSKEENVYIRIIVSRGEGYPVLDPRVVKRPTLVVLLHDPTPPVETGSSYNVHGSGLRLKTAGVRKVPPESFEPRVKNLNYLNNVMARIEAIESGHDEAILLDLRGFVAEAPGENVFIVSSGVLKTPKATNVLDGITRRTVLELATRESMLTEETDLTLYDLYTADEVFLTSSFSRVHGVAEVDGRKISCPGPVTLQLQKQIAELEHTEGEPVD